MENIDEPKKIFSEKCTWVSFIMTLFVLYIHADNLKEFGLTTVTTSLDYVLYHILARGIGRVAVPFFFMISGYWFFRFDICSINSTELLKLKLKKRIRTLLIPYLLWNTFGMVFYMVLTRLSIATSIMNASETIPITVETIINGVIFHANYFTFWYLQDLIVLTMITPIILLILKNERISKIILCIIVIGCCLNINVYIIQIQSLFFFMLGGYMAVNKRDVFENKQIKIVSIISLLLFVVFGFIRYMKIPYLTTIVLLVSPLLIWNAFDLFRLRKMRWIYSQSFFIYAAQAIPVTIVMKVLAKIAKFIGGDYAAAAAYFVTPWITLLILYFVAKILSQIAKKFYHTICGNR